MKQGISKQGYLFPEQSPWKPLQGKPLIFNFKLNICGIECKCLSASYYENIVTIDLYCEKSPDNFTIFHIGQSKINGISCEVLNSFSYKQRGIHCTHEDVFELCRQYNVKCTQGIMIQRIVLSNLIIRPDLSISILFLNLQEDSCICSRIILEKGMIYAENSF